MTGQDGNYFASFQPRNPNSSPLPQNIALCSAQREDAYQLAALHCERAGGSLRQIQGRFEEEISGNSGWKQRWLLVAKDSATVVGYGRVAYFKSSVESAANIAPTGWYLGGLAITPFYRRRGIGAELTRQRLDWINAKSGEAFYFVNAQNQASIALHKALGFVEVTRDFFYPGVTFAGGKGILYRVGFNDRGT